MATLLVCDLTLFTIGLRRLLTDRITVPFLMTCFAIYWIVGYTTIIVALPWRWLAENFTK